MWPPSWSPRAFASSLAIPMHNVASTVPIPRRKAVKVMSGQIVLSGDALANTDGGADDVLVIDRPIADRLAGPTRRVSPAHHHLARCWRPRAVRPRSASASLA